MTQESKLQSEIIKYLQHRKKDIYFVRNNSFSGRIIRANGTRGWVNNSKKGTPDIIILHKSKWIGLELKSDIGRQSKEQKQAQTDIERCGGKYYIIRDLLEVKKLLK